MLSPKTKAIEQIFDYELPEEKIAQWPVSLTGRRDSAKLLHAKVDPCAGLQLKDRVFSDLPSLLEPGDLLILNNSRVRNCRFYAKGLEREFEILLLAPESSGVERWTALAKPKKRLRQGARISLSARIEAEVIENNLSSSNILLELSGPKNLEQAIEEDGLTPIPPYIRKGRSNKQDRALYQTVYSQITGSAAAPTAGLHFTEELLAETQEKGIRTAYLTLHVGQGGVFKLLENLMKIFRFRKKFTRFHKIHLS